MGPALSTCGILSTSIFITAESCHCKTSTLRKLPTTSSSLRITTIIGVKFEPAPSRRQQLIQSLATTMSPPLRRISFLALHISVVSWILFVSTALFPSKRRNVRFVNRRRYNITDAWEPFDPFHSGFGKQGYQRLLWEGI